MKIKFKYHFEDCKFPEGAPIINGVVVEDTFGEKHEMQYDAIIDSASNVTVIPLELVSILNLIPIGRKRKLFGVDKNAKPTISPMYKVKLNLGKLGTHELSVCCSRRSTIVLGHSFLEKKSVFMCWKKKQWVLYKRNIYMYIPFWY